MSGGAAVEVPRGATWPGETSLEMAVNQRGKNTAIHHPWLGMVYAISGEIGDGLLIPLIKVAKIGMVSYYFNNISSSFAAVPSTFLGGFWEIRVDPTVFWCDSQSCIPRTSSIGTCPLPSSRRDAHSDICCCQDLLGNHCWLGCIEMYCVSIVAMKSQGLEHTWTIASIYPSICIYSSVVSDLSWKRLESFVFWWS